MRVGERGGRGTRLQEPTLSRIFIGIFIGIGKGKAICQVMPNYDTFSKFFENIRNLPHSAMSSHISECYRNLAIIVQLYWLIEANIIGLFRSVVLCQSEELFKLFKQKTSQ